LAKKYFSKKIVAIYTSKEKRCIFVKQNRTDMATVKTNKWNLKVGDVISFTNYAGSFRSMEVKRVSEASIFTPSRKSFGTIADYEKCFADFKITRAK
jgi:hypothetical protein